MSTCMILAQYIEFMYNYILAAHTRDAAQKIITSFFWKTAQ